MKDFVELKLLRFCAQTQGELALVDDNLNHDSVGSFPLHVFPGSNCS